MTSDVQALARLWPLLGDHRRKFVATVLAGLVAQLSATVASVGAAWLVGRAVSDSSAAPWSGPGGAVLVAVAVSVLLVGVATWWEMFVAHDLAYLVLASLRVRLFDRLRRILPSRSRAARSGDLSSVAMADVESLEWIYAHVFAQVFAAATILTGGAVALALIHPVLLVVLLPTAALVVSVPWWLRQAADRQGTELRERSAVLGSDVVDLLQGLTELTAADALELRRQELAESTAALTKLGRRTAGRVGVEIGAAEVLLSAAGVVALLLTVPTSSGVPIAMVPVVLTLTGAVLAPAAAVASTLKEAGSLRAAATRIFTVMDTPNATLDATMPVVATRDLGAPVLAFDDVQFGYDPERPVLRSLSFAVHRGETVALVGHSGCGKSTTVGLIQRFWDPDLGTVRLSGQDVRQVPDDQLRRRIAVVGQDVQLFAGTLEENLMMAAPDASLAEVDAVMTTARIDALADRLPQGRNTMIGERGTRLSGGERARAAVARALLVQPELLVLDEAVANLDASTERELHRALRAGSATRATVVVAHRRSTILRADRVVVLADGVIVQQGSPMTLLTSPGPLSALLGEVNAEHAQSDDHAQSGSD